MTLTQDFAVQKDKFIFLDWRQDFAGFTDIGDIYYDLAKILHGLIVSHEIVTKNLFQISWRKNINFDFNRKYILVECEGLFYSWLEEKGFNITKTKILTALIFLNIASLHHEPYNFLLYALGKTMLNQTITIDD